MTKRIIVIILIGNLFLLTYQLFNKSTKERFIKPNFENSYIDSIYSELIFENKISNFGIVTNDTIVCGTYYFKNISNNPLYIRYVDPDCTCTSYNVSSDTISPGNSEFIQLFMDTREKYGETKTYAVVCSNTENRFHKLILKGTIDRTVKK
jgi:hypothetical protein